MRALLVLALALPVVAHSTYEAAELEVHFVNDEGSDAIEAYGGYDIQEVFAGFAHDPLVGDGPDGDGFYVRLELYGDRAESLVPQGAANWSIEIQMRIGGAPLVRHLWSTDGRTLSHDFDALQYEVEGRDVHIQRAFLAYARHGFEPGMALQIDQVTSMVDGDPRDIAPGGIPVPGSGGAIMYPEPTAIDGGGRLVESTPLQGPGAYVVVQAVAVAPAEYEVHVTSGLSEGSQHILLRSLSPSLAIHGNSAVEVGPRGDHTFRLVRQAEAEGELALDVITDVGGRARLVTSRDDLLLPDGSRILGLTEAAPSLSALVPLLVALAFVRRR